jgi:hypothetical protein
MKVRNEAVPSPCLFGSESLRLPATVRTEGVVRPGAGRIDLSMVGASTAARYHSPARASGWSWPPRPPGVRGAL